MKKIFAFSILILLTCTITAFAVDPGEPDTIRIGTTSAYAGGTAVLPVYFAFDETILAAEVILKYDTNFLSIDSFLFDDGLFSMINEDSAEYRDSANLVDLFIGDINGFAPDIGLFCNYYFTVDVTAGNQNITIDTAYWPIPPPGKKRSQFVTGGTTPSTILPVIVPGEIAVLPPPPSYDSVIVDSIGVVSGNTAELEIVVYNEENLDSIDIALEWSSSNLSYSTTVFAGTRGATALNKPVYVSGQQMLISLKFPAASPLTPGRGVIAKVVFDVPSGVPYELVTIDSTTYSDNWPTLFRTAEETRVFTPFFAKGYIDIKQAMGIDDYDGSTLPTEYALAQNHPNPFNPSTSISFALPRASEVRLTVFNILGEEVRTLVNERLNAGVHQIAFDGRDNDHQELASGIYFYRIRTSDYTASKKMMLLK